MSSRLSRRNLMCSALAGTAAPFLMGAERQQASLADQITDLRRNPQALTADRLRSLQDASTRAQMERLNQLGVLPANVNDVNAPWEMFLHRLKDYVAGGDPKNVQLVTAPRAATWSDPAYGPYRLCKILGDSMPKWGATYEPALGNSFGDMYGIFLSNLVIPQGSQDDQKKAEKARKEWQKSLNKIQSRKATIGDRWKSFDDRQQSLPPASRMKYQEWYQEFEAPIIGSMQDDLNLKSQSYIFYVNKAGAGYAVVAQKISSFSQEAATFLTAAEGSGTSRMERVYRYNAGDSLDAWVNSVKNQPPNAVDWDFNNSSFRLTADQTSWGGSASWGLFFHGGASGGSSHLDWHSSSFKLKFTCKGMQRFDIVPGDWYSAGLIKLFKAGKFVENGPIDSAYQAGTLWGSGGVFSLRAAAVIAVYEPSISVTMAQADYERNYSYWNGSAGIGIGPFSFGASAGGSHEDIHFDSASSTVTAKDTTGVPKIVAVVTDVLPDLA
jgi:hypothetical protein